YDEFSITPQGYDPTAVNGQATAGSFGKAYFAMTGEIGARLSQMLYINMFVDAGNVWAHAGEFDPTRLLHGDGLGLRIISPLRPNGIDWADSFDRTDSYGRAAPGTKRHV